MNIRFSANHSIRFVIALLTILAFSFSTVDAAFQKNDSYSADSNAAISTSWQNGHKINFAIFCQLPLSIDGV